MDQRVAGVVLAAGASHRLGQPKQLLRGDDGQPLVALAVQRLIDAGCAPVVVITGFGHDDVTRAVGPVDATVLFNEAWADGMSASIRCAVVWLESQDHGPTPLCATVMAACDMPSVTADHVRRLLERSNRGRTRVASEYPGARGAMVRGIPAVLPRDDWPALKAIAGDRGARELLQAPDTVSVFLRDGNFDLDTPDDVIRWRDRSSAEHAGGEHRTNTES